MSNLKMSISGVRGIVGESFDEELVKNFAHSFTFFLDSLNHEKKLIIIANDSRPSYKQFEPLIIESLNECGYHVINLGIAPTPTVLFTVRDLAASGGLILSASHNPIEWNGLKFVNNLGEFINQDQWLQLKKNFDDKVKNINTGKKADFEYRPDLLENHINKALSLCDIDKMKKAKFKVAFDACNGAGSVITEKLLNKLDCDIVSIYNQAENEGFGRKPEPLTENLKDLEKLVLENNCDIGFALDPDADRLAIVSEKGKAIGEEFTLAIALDQYLSKEKSDVAVNISTSRMVDDIAKKHNVKVHRSKVGEINVLDRMKANSCKIGGEGNGGVIIPEINSARDSQVSIVMALNAMLEKNKTVSELVSDIPNYAFIKDKVEVEGIDLDSFYKALLEKYSSAKINDIDGKRIDLEDMWFQIRESNTEPIIRIFAEGPSEKECRNFIDDLKSWIKKFKN